MSLLDTLHHYINIASPTEKSVVGHCILFVGKSYHMINAHGSHRQTKQIQKSGLCCIRFIMETVLICMEQLV